MKKFSFLALAAAAILTGCSSEEPAVNGGGNEVSDGARFLSVNIVPAPDAGSRAAGDQFTEQDPNGNATYEYGTAAENEVKTVRFYFFDDNGKAVDINGNLNYTAPMDGYSDFGNNGEVKPNVEKILNSVVIINSKENAQLPTQLVVVLNGNSVCGDGSLDLSALRAKYHDFASANHTGAEGFVMINSVYMLDGKEINYTKLDPSNFRDTPEAALKAPTTVYVERSVAKVRVNTSMEKTTLTDSEGNNVDVYTPTATTDGTDQLTIKVNGTDKNVYVKVLGWNTTATVDEAYLIKHINTGWGEIIGADNPWNYAPYFRSFWAISYDQRVNKYQDFAASHSFALGAAGTYCNENTEDEWEGKSVLPTKIIVPAQLVDETGAPLTIYEYAGVKYVAESTDTKDLNSLKGIYANFADYYHAVPQADGTTKYESMHPADIKLVSAVELNNGISTGKGDYEVYAQLSETGVAQDWYVYNPNAAKEEDKYTKVVAAEGKTAIEIINEDLISLRSSKIWQDGMTYYFHTIQHFAPWGVVRNHIYDITIDKITGFGTPVYDPSYEIIPEVTVDEELYLAANINILSWRVVFNKVNL